MTIRRALAIGANVTVLGLLLAGLWVVWPQSLGGSVAYVKVDGHSMDGTYRTGDLVAVRRHADYRIGDVVAYRIPRDEFGAGAEVIHRIIGGSGSTGFTTKGDNKPLPDPWHPRASDVVGRPWFHVAGAGTRMASLARPIPLGALCAGLTVAVMLVPRRRRSDRATAATA